MRLIEKFPRIHHLPYSEEVCSDEKRLHFAFEKPVPTKDEQAFEERMLNHPIVFTLKMDGSNVCLHKDGVFSRGGSKPTHPSFDLLKQKHAAIQHNLPDDLLIFGEWLYAKHSIHYKGINALSDYLQIFQIFNQNTMEFLSWDDLIFTCSVLELTPVHAIHRVPISLLGLTQATGVTGDYIHDRSIANFCKLCKKFKEKYVDGFGHEGFVVRPSSSFPADEFKYAVAKFVRRNHVQTDEHWAHQPIVKNELKPISESL